MRANPTRTRRTSFSVRISHAAFARISARADAERTHARTIGAELLEAAVLAPPAPESAMSGAQFRELMIWVLRAERLLELILKSNPTVIGAAHDWAAANVDAVLAGRPVETPAVSKTPAAAPPATPPVVNRPAGSEAEKQAWLDQLTGATKPPAQSEAEREALLERVTGRKR